MYKNDYKTVTIELKFIHSIQTASNIVFFYIYSINVSSYFTLRQPQCAIHNEAYTVQLITYVN